MRLARKMRGRDAHDTSSDSDDDDSNQKYLGKKQKQRQKNNYLKVGNANLSITPSKTPRTRRDRYFAVTNIVFLPAFLVFKVRNSWIPGFLQAMDAVLNCQSTSIAQVLRIVEKVSSGFLNNAPDNLSLNQTFQKGNIKFATPQSRAFDTISRAGIHYSVAISSVRYFLGISLNLEMGLATMRLCGHLTS